MGYFKNLKTSDRIAFTFSFVNLLSLIILLVSINIIYFFIWYDDQKQESLYDMNINYDSYTGDMSEDNKEAFQKYILEKDSIIIPHDGGELICSNGTLEKLHDDPELIKDKLFYTSDNKRYFIFSKYYEGIGEVKVLFDTTTYIKSQIIIIKISLVIILISIILSLFLGKIFARYSLKNLKKICETAKDLSLNKKFTKIDIEGNKEDEINILAEAINTSMLKIETQSDNLKQFITDVSHEFKTPLMIINSKIDLYNKVLEKGDLRKEDVHETLDYIKQNTKKLNELLEALFLLSRFQEGIVKFDKQNIDLSKHIKSISNDFAENFDTNKINISYKIQKQVFQNIELSTFSIIISNLLTNAVKFSPKGGEIEIGIDGKGFWVKDNGVGIDEQTLEKIWDKFYKGDDKIEGFGVGLFIVKRIADLYNWKVNVISQKQKGTKVTLSFK